MIALPLILGLIFGGIAVGGTGAYVYEHEREPLVVESIPMPPPRPPLPVPPVKKQTAKHKPQPVLFGVPHSRRDDTAAPPPPVVEPEPTPEPEQPRVVLPNPVEPEAAPAPTTAPVSPVDISLWGVIKDVLWKLVYAALFFGAGFLIVGAVRSVISIKNGTIK